MSSLDGFNVLRYGHVYDSAGGMEQYLADLNGALHARSAFRTVQLQLTSHTNAVADAEEGPVRKVSLFVSQASHEKAVNGWGKPSPLAPLKKWLRESILVSPLMYRPVTRQVLRRRPVSRRAGEPSGAGAAVLSLHRQRPIDLICLHTIGGADTAEILAVAGSEGIPAVYIHHFSNDRLAALSVRLQLEEIQGVAGVCPVDVPAYLEGRFVSVLDGIDTDFFRPGVSRENAAANGFALFLPARITPTKGQSEVIRAAGLLTRRGLDIKVRFAGRTDSPEYTRTLERLVEREGMAGRVEFVGPVGAEQLREYYSQSDLVVFPTTHHEGLPRIMLECQSMGVPPVLYDSGGAGSGIQNGITGEMVPTGDFRALVDKIEHLLRNKSARLAMGRAGREFVAAKFSLSHLAERHEEFYLRALSLKPLSHAAPR